MKWFDQAGWVVSPAALRRILLFATPAVTPAADGAAGGGAPPAPAGGGGGTPPSPGTGAQPGGTPPPAPNPNDANLRTLRETHDRYSRLGKPEELEPVVQGFRQAETRAVELATALRYNVDQVKAALLTDPVGTIQRLASEYDQAQRTAADPNAPPPDPRELIRSELDKQIGPIRAHINAQRADAANTAFTNTFTQLLTGHDEFKGAAVPDDVRSLIFDMTSELMKNDEAALQALLQGKTSDVKKHFDAAVERFFKVANGYSQYRTSRPSGGAPPANGNGQPTPPASQKPTIDDFILGNERAQAVAPSFRPR